MKKWILSLSLVFSALALFSQTLADGLSQLEGDNVAAAKKTFFGLLKQDPKSSAALYYLGNIAYADDNIDSAAWYFNKAHEVAPDNYYSLVGAGIMLLDKNKAGEADKSFAKAKKSARGADLPVVLGLVGDAYLQSRHPNYDKAVDAFKEARELDTKTARYFVGYGDAMLAKDNIGDALTSYEFASKKDKDNPEILMKIARAYYKNGVKDVAIEQLESGIQKFPNYAPAYKELYQLYFQKGQYSKVTPLLEKYVTLVGNDVEQRARLVKFLCFQAKDYKKSVEEAKTVLQQQPSNYAMYRWIAWSDFELGEYQASFDASKKLFEMVGTRPVYPSDYEYYAKAASKLNQTDIAIKNYQKVVELDSTRADVYDLVAKAYYDGKKWPEAEAAYQAKLASGKPNSQDYYFLGMSRYQQNKNVEADSAFAKLVEMQPAYATGWLMRARSNNRLDPDRKSFQAKPFYEKYIPLAEPDAAKNKKQLVEAYNFVGYYCSQHDDLSGSLSWYEKSFGLDSANEEAKNAIQQLKTAMGGK